MFHIASYFLSQVYTYGVTMGNVDHHTNYQTVNLLLVILMGTQIRGVHVVQAMGGVVTQLLTALVLHVLITARARTKVR